MNLISFLRKKYKKPFLGALFAFVFLFSFFVTNQKAEAQNIYLDEFKCLFEPFVGIGGTACDHSATPEQIKSGQKSGIAYGKPAEGAGFVTDTGIKGVTMLLSLNMDPDKVKIGTTNEDKNYFYSRVADDQKNSFVVRLGYKDANGTQKYKLQKVSYTKNATTVTSTLLSIGGVPIPWYSASYSTNSSGALVKIPFFTQNGDNVVTKQVVQATIDLGTEIPYNTSVSADFWYCGGLQNDSPKHDGRYAKPGDRVEYFTPDGKYAYWDDNGVLTLKTDGNRYEGVDKGLCITGTEGVKDPTKPNLVNIAAGTAHYKIGETITFETPKNKDEATTQQSSTLDTGIKGTESVADSLPACAVTYFGDGSLMGCVARVIYYVFYWPIAWVAGILGKVFDFFLGYSLSDESYRATIIVTGWKLVRDISNIFFIIILIYTGLATVFGFDGVSMKKVVPAVIINALLINFSLFGTQVVIDISNITARVFYNTMSVCDGDCRYIDTPKGKIIENPSGDTVGGYKPLSQKIVSSFNPQRVFNTSALDDGKSLPEKGGNAQSATVGGFNSQGADENLSTASTKSRYSSDYAGYFIVITLIAAFIMFAIAKMFFGVMFMFVGRVVGLYLVMIFSPFAVLTRGNMPIVGGIKELAWENWKRELIEYSLLAPIFVFFLYIIYAFINSDMTKVFLSNNSGSFMETVLTIAIPMIIIYTLIGYGVNLAKKYAGKAGEMLQKLGTQATGLAGGAAVGVATGGLAWGGRNIIGRGLGAIGNIKTTRMVDGKEVKESLSSRWAANANNSWLARQWNNTYSKSQTGSWDVRNAGVKIGGKEYNANSALSSGLSKFGIGLSDKVSGAIGLGQDKALGKDGKPGGNIMIDKKRAENLQKQLEEKIQMSHLSEDEAKAAWEIYKRKSVEKSVNESEEIKTQRDEVKKAQTALDEAKINLEKAKKEGTTYEQTLATNAYNAANEKFKKAQEEEVSKKDELIKKATEDKFKKYGKIKDAKGFATVMRAEYAEKLKEKAIINDLLNSKGLFASIVGGLAAGMGPGLVTLGGMFGGQLTKEIIDNATGARSKALKAMIDKATKGSGLSSALGKLEAKVTKYEEQIISVVSEAMGKSYKDYTELEESGDLDRGLAKKEAELDDEIEELTKKIKDPKTSAADRKEALYQRQLKKNLITKLKNALKDLEQANKNLNDYKDKQKEKEEKEAEKKKDK